MTRKLLIRHMVELNSLQSEAMVAKGSRIFLITELIFNTLHNWEWCRIHMFLSKKCLITRIPRWLVSWKWYGVLSALLCSRTRNQGQNTEMPELIIRHGFTNSLPCASDVTYWRWNIFISVELSHPQIVQAHLVTTISQITTSSPSRLF